MTDLLKKVKLADHLTTELTIQKKDFITKLKDHVDEGRTGIFSDITDVFSSSTNEYKGYVGPDHFKIQKRKKLFDMNVNRAIASGQFIQENDRLIIKTMINGFHGYMVPVLLVIIGLYLIFIAGLLSSDNVPVFVPPFLMIHAMLMLGIPYFIVRRSVSRMKRELEREFYFLTK